MFVCVCVCVCLYLPNSCTSSMRQKVIFKPSLTDMSLPSPRQVVISMLKTPSYP